MLRRWINFVLVMSVLVITVIRPEVGRPLYVDALGYPVVLALVCAFVWLERRHAWRLLASGSTDEVPTRPSRARTHNLVLFGHTPNRTFSLRGEEYWMVKTNA